MNYLDRKLKIEKVKERCGTLISERTEFLYHKLAKLLGSPKCYTSRQICKVLGIDRRTLNNWRQDPTFIKIKNSYLKAIRDEYEIEIQAKVIQKALQGSKYHIDTFYQLQGSFAAQKLQITKGDEIPDDPQERQAEIDRLITQTRDFDPVSIPNSASVKIPRMEIHSERENGSGSNKS